MNAKQAKNLKKGDEVFVPGRGKSRVAEVTAEQVHIAAPLTDEERLANRHRYFKARSKYLSFAFSKMKEIEHYTGQQLSVDLSKLPKTSHSEKALETFRQMDTKPQDWALTPIKWKRVRMAVKERIMCPKCYGMGTVLTKDHKDYEICKNCDGTRKITRTRNRLVWVGTPQWARGTKFDSRFGFTARFNCELCSKTIKNPFSGLVPVTGTDSEGRYHGMYVGADCARKFMGIKNYKKDKESILAVPKRRDRK